MKFCDMPYQRIDFAEAKKELNALMEEFKQMQKHSLKFIKSIIN